MNYFDYYQVITLIVFLLVFFGRTIWLRIALGFQFQIRQEETFLIERYGDNYREYMAQVNRYI